MLVRLTRLVYKSNTGGCYTPADWGDEAVNLRFVCRATSEKVTLANNRKDPVDCLLLYMEGQNETPRRYLGTLDGLLELQARAKA